jgi:DNA polymerase
VGTERYLAAHDADIVCLAYRINAEKTKLWLPGSDVVPFDPDDFDRIYAFNAFYDFRVWNYLGVKKYGFNYWPLHKTVDVMAICGRYTYPQSLEASGKALKLGKQKDKKGKALMKKISCPPFNYTRQDLLDYYRYCIRDVDSLCEEIDALPADTLSESEQAIWEATMSMNSKGLPIDVKAVRRINQVVKYYKKEQTELFRDITDNELDSPSQTIALAKWCTEQGVPMPNCTADTVEKVLKQPNLPYTVKAALMIRQECGQSSVSKYQKLEDMIHDGTIYDNLRYYGAAPGRWSGMGFQAQNLPRAKVDDPESVINSFYDASVLKHGMVIDKAKALIRSMIKAEDGYELAVADYSAIENRMLMWLADELKALELLSDGRCMYRDMAADLFGKKYEGVTDDERLVGKTIILGCGYGLSGAGYVRYAGGYGLVVSRVQGDKAVQTYRTKYAGVPKYWKAVHSAAIKALRNPGEVIYAGKCVFQYVLDRNKTPWLKVILPSGRPLVYNNPRVGSGRYGDTIFHMGLRSSTNQWIEFELSSIRLTENIDQASSRDIMAKGAINLIKAGFDLRLLVHDEVICQVRKDGNEERALKMMIRLLCTKDNWAKDIPLNAEGYLSERYKK